MFIVLKKSDFTFSGQEMVWDELLEEANVPSNKNKDNIVLTVDIKEIAFEED